MPEIRMVKKYRVAKYPRGIYQPKKRHPLAAMAEKGAISALLFTLLEACDSTGVTGPPPVVPDLVTENEARLAINQVFVSNSLPMTADQQLRLHFVDGDSADIVLDGYNDSVQVGYEYLTGDDLDSFTEKVVNQLDSLAGESGPYIKTVDQIRKDVDDQQYLDSVIQEFIDSLKSQGAI